MRFYWLAIVLLAAGYLSLSSCEEAIDWQAEGLAEPLLVVEGRITNERRVHTVRLSHTVNSLNELPPPARRALVRVSDGETLYAFREVEPGVYESEPFRAVFGQAYYLYIRYQQQDYLAVTFMVPVAPLPPLEVEAVDSLLRYKPGTSNNPAMEEVRLDWSAVEGYQHLPPEETRAQLYYYTLETLDVPQLFAPEQQEVLFPRGTKIVRRNYSLSAEQQAFVRSFLFETQWQGSPFDTERANVLTNMQGGALGYFAANTVVSDSTVVE